MRRLMCLLVLFGALGIAGCGGGGNEVDRPEETPPLPDAPIGASAGGGGDQANQPDPPPTTTAD